jgi:hypothetical protein
VSYDALQGVAHNLHPSALMKINLSHSPATNERLPRLPEGTTVAKLVGSGVTGTLSYVSAMLTTVVESGGFWQYFWLGACILFFVGAVSLVILATREGLRIDHAGLSFERRGTSSVAKQTTGISEDHRAI